METVACQGVLFVGIDEQDVAQDALGTMSRYGITYPNVLDTDRTTLSSYKLDSTPQTAFVNRFGSLVGGRIVGLVSTAELDSNIKLALASKASATGADVSVVAGKPSEFSFTLSRLSVPHGWVTFNITNQGRLRHEFEVCASSKGGLANTCGSIGASAGILPGESTTLAIDFTSPGTYEFLCRITGHSAKGMKGLLKVT